MYNEELLCERAALFLLKILNSDFDIDTDNDNDTDFIYIHNNEMIINNIEGNGLVQIYDMMGRSVATYNVSGSANISMETLSNGVYVVRMTDANGVKTQKVVNN